MSIYSLYSKSKIWTKTMVLLGVCRFRKSFTLIVFFWWHSSTPDELGCLSHGCHIERKSLLSRFVRVYIFFRSGIVVGLLPEMHPDHPCGIFIPGIYCLVAFYFFVSSQYEIRGWRYEKRHQHNMFFCLLGCRICAKDMYIQFWYVSWRRMKHCAWDTYTRTEMKTYTDFWAPRVCVQRKETSAIWTPPFNALTIWWPPYTRATRRELFSIFEFSHLLLRFCKLWRKKTSRAQQEKRTTRVVKESIPKWLELTMNVCGKFSAHNVKSNNIVCVLLCTPDFTWLEGK